MKRYNDEQHDEEIEGNREQELIKEAVADRKYKSEYSESQIHKDRGDTEGCEKIEGDCFCCSEIVKDYLT